MHRDEIVGVDLGLVAAAVARLLGRSMGSDEAYELVRLCTRTADARHVPLRTALLEDARVSAAISAADLDEALDPYRQLGSAGEMIDAALRAHRDVDANRGAG